METNLNFLLIFLGKPSLTDLSCFWTASNQLPSRGGTIQVKFNDGDSKLPLAETCFSIITLPTVHKSFEDFCKSMDTALLYGSMGIDIP